MLSIYLSIYLSISCLLEAIILSTPVVRSIDRRRNLGFYKEGKDNFSSWLVFCEILRKTRPVPTKCRHVVIHKVDAADVSAITVTAAEGLV